MRVCILLLIFFVQPVKGQVQSATGDLTTTFVFQVQSIDDFFDRFNFRKNTGFLNYLKKNYPEKTLTRKDLIFSLFNASNQTLKNQETIDFISQVTDSVKPAFMRYSDNEWYAELSCKVYYRNSPVNLLLGLKVKRWSGDAFSWMVVSANADFLKVKTPLADSLIYLANNSKDNNDGIKKYSLSPVSHGIDFINLDNIFINKAYINDYIGSEFHSPELNRLILLIKKSQVRFVQVNTIKYHLLQVDGWIARVEFAERNDKTSGWRINMLTRATAAEKKKYLKKYLNLQKS